MGMNPIEAVEQLYEVVDKDLVRGFLEVHPHLASLLLEARAYARKAFNDAPPCQLELIGDPESGDVVLEAKILTSMPIKDALEGLSRFDNAYWLDNQSRAKGQLFYTI